VQTNTALVVENINGRLWRANIGTEISHILVWTEQYSIISNGKSWIFNLVLSTGFDQNNPFDQMDPQGIFHSIRSKCDQRAYYSPCKRYYVTWFETAQKIWSLRNWMRIRPGDDLIEWGSIRRSKPLKIWSSGRFIAVLWNAWLNPLRRGEFVPALMPSRVERKVRYNWQRAYPWLRGQMQFRIPSDGSKLKKIFRVYRLIDPYDSIEQFNMNIFMIFTQSW
jgi:hypothetical protein